MFVFPYKKAALFLAVGCFSVGAAYAQADSTYQSASKRLAEKLKQQGVNLSPPASMAERPPVSSPAPPASKPPVVEAPRPAIPGAFTMSCSTWGFDAVFEGGQTYNPYRGTTVSIKRYKITKKQTTGGNRAYLYFSVKPAPNTTDYLAMKESGPLRQDGKWNTINMSHEQFMRDPEVSMRINFDDSGRNTRCMMKKRI